MNGWRPWVRKKSLNLLFVRAGEYELDEAYRLGSMRMTQSQVESERGFQDSPKFSLV